MCAACDIFVCVVIEKFNLQKQIESWKVDRCKENHEYSKSKPVKKFNELPREILSIIFSFGTHYLWCNAAKVCKAWNKVIYESPLWKVREQHEIKCIGLFELFEN